MPTCPACNRDQVQSSAFCAYCGAVLDRPSRGAAAPASQAVPPSSAAAEPPAPPKPAHEFGDVGLYIVRRFLALIVDLALVGTFIAVALRALVVGAAAGSQMTTRGFFELTVLVGVAFFAYRWLFEGIGGSTLGKLVFGLGVGQKGGGRTGLTRAFVRTVFLPLDLALIGFLLATVTPDRRRLGDLAAGTVVANSRLGPLAPLIGLIALAAAAFGDYAYAGGVDAARNLANETTRLAPLLVQPQSPSPVSTATPLPSPSAKSTT